MIRRPASLHAVPRCVRVPALPRYYQGAATSCRSSRRASFPSLGGAVDAFADSLPPVVNARPTGPDCLRSASPCRSKSSTETTGSPKFLGNPHCTFAGTFDPGRTSGV
jgi:hypothetical protein